MVATISVNEPLPDGRTPGQVAAQALVNHRSQAFGNSGNSPWLQRPQKFTLAKAFVHVSGTASDLMQGLPTLAASTSPVAFGSARSLAPFEMEFVPRPALAQYRKWVKEQAIEQLVIQFQSDLPLVAGEAKAVSLHMANRETAVLEGDLAIIAPAGWLVEPARQHIRIGAAATFEIELRITPPAEVRSDAELSAIFTNNGSTFETKAKLHPLPHGRAIRLKTPPGLDGTDHGWEEIPTLTISPADLVQGKVRDEADSSAVFRVAHDGKTLFVDVQVKDDVVITNIAPNDIRGHWRSDSVEICLDPVGGAEHTMGCYKLGIFPLTPRASSVRPATQMPTKDPSKRPHPTPAWCRGTADGYRIQAAIPFEEIGLAPGKKRLGFNLIIYDGDKLNAALGENINKSRIAWAPRSGVQGRPEDWGRIDLE